MKTITLLDNDSVSLYCYPEHGIVHHEIHKFVFGEPWREMMIVNTGMKLQFLTGATLQTSGKKF